MTQNLPRKKRASADDPNIFLIDPEAFYPVEVIAKKCKWINTRNVSEHLFKQGLKKVRLGNYTAVYGQDLLDFMLSNRE
jgi:hypothetical protein